MPEIIRDAQDTRRGNLGLRLLPAAEASVHQPYLAGIAGIIPRNAFALGINIARDEVAFDINVVAGTAAGGYYIRHKAHDVSPGVFAEAILHYRHHIDLVRMRRKLRLTQYYRRSFFHRLGCRFGRLYGNVGRRLSAQDQAIDIGRGVIGGAEGGPLPAAGIMLDTADRERGRGIIRPMCIRIRLGNCKGKT